MIDVGTKLDINDPDRQAKVKGLDPGRMRFLDVGVGDQKKTI